MSLESELRTAHAGQLRLFIAILFPTGLRTELLKVQGELKALLPAKAAAWTKPEAMHLTLRFLGNVDSASVSELCQRLSSRLAGFTGLDLICERLGCFPDLRFPRVVWAWVHDEAERLEQFRARIDATAADFAEKPAEARFVGHITLARIKQINRHDAEPLARFVESAVHRRFCAWHANSVVLMQSQLSPTGAIYTERLHVHLV